ncbi:unnamed protein product [Paramecium sonneborni]|uniref:Uncharacterized protein n=1 Tax=Paramecium sonneborni TaxID=65129 RepID=A0A8S1QTA6_9CILI|nr:unnamed protein product [Paramecium sonneborni]
MNMNTGLNQTNYKGLQNMTPSDIDFNQYQQSIENIIKNNQIGFKYKEQLDQKAQRIIKTIEFYLAKLRQYNANPILYCEFTFNNKLQLFIKEQNIVQEFLNQFPPHLNDQKNKQLDLNSALIGIKNFILEQSSEFNKFVLYNSQLQGDIWNQSLQYLNKNNVKESQNFLNQAEKYRRNMIQQLIKTENLNEYVEFSFFIDNYAKYFDFIQIQERIDIYQQFKQLLKLLNQSQDAKNFTSRFFANNNIKMKNQTYYVNSLINSQNQILIPKFIWDDICRYQLQGYILCIMIQLEELNLNFSTMQHIINQDHLRNCQAQIKQWKLSVD